MEEIKPAEAKSSGPAAESTRRRRNQEGISMRIRPQGITFALRQPWSLDRSAA